MITRINLILLVLSTLLFLFFYVKSAGPAALEKRIGPVAYEKCARHRLIASLFMSIACVSYVIYVFYPLPIALARTWPWSWWISALIAVSIAIPAGYLWLRGIKDAGEETMVPKKEHSLYQGIYTGVRHPQALGELLFWWMLAFVLHSPFLALYSFVWVPVFVVICWTEERDLLIRYGEAYAAYRDCTGFLIPRTGPRGRRERKGFPASIVSLEEDHVKTVSRSD